MKIHLQRVEYFGNEMLVPDWTRYIATNHDGQVWAFSVLPMINRAGPFEPCWDRSAGMKFPIARAYFEGEYWPHTCVAVSDIRQHPPRDADTQVLDWVLPILTGEDSESTNRRTALIAQQLMMGKDGRNALLAVMKNDCPPTDPIQSQESRS